MKNAGERRRSRPRTRSVARILPLLIRRRIPSRLFRPSEAGRGHTRRNALALPCPSALAARHRHCRRCKSTVSDKNERRRTKEIPLSFSSERLAASEVELPVCGARPRKKGPQPATAAARTVRNKPRPARHTYLRTLTISFFTRPSPTIGACASSGMKIVNCPGLSV